LSKRTNNDDSHLGFLNKQQIEVRIIYSFTLNFRNNF